MTLGRVTLLTGAGPAADRTVPTQPIRHGVGNDLGALRQVRSVTLRFRSCGGLGATGHGRLVAGFAQSSHGIHLAHRRVTGMTLLLRPYPSARRSAAIDQSMGASDTHLAPGRCGEGLRMIE